MARKPDFLGVGVLRAGTTWLHEQLRSHTLISLPSKKELHYFDRNYDQPIDWYYNKLGCTGENVCGEITPTYFHRVDARERIKEHLPDCRFLLTLRDPVERLYSHYKKHFRDMNLDKGFDEFVDKDKIPFKAGLYGKHLASWFEDFDRGQFKIILFEDINSNKRKVLEEVEEFLNVGHGSFRQDKVKERDQESFIPRNRKVYSILYRTYRFCMRNDLGFIPEGLKRIGIVDKVKDWMKGGKKFEGITLEQKRKVYKMYKKDIEILEGLLDKDLDGWKY